MLRPVGAERLFDVAGEIEHSGADAEPVRRVAAETLKHPWRTSKDERAGEFLKDAVAMGIEGGEGTVPSGLGVGDGLVWNFLGQLDPAESRLRAVQGAFQAGDEACGFGGNLRFQTEERAALLREVFFKFAAADFRGIGIRRDEKDHIRSAGEGQVAQKC